MRKLLVLAAVGLLAFPTAASAAERQVHTMGTSFMPGRVIALRGDSVRWTNTDLQRHDVQGIGIRAGA